MSNFYANPQPTTDPPEPPLGGANMIFPKGEPVNWSTRNKCEKMDTAELEIIVREASRVLEERKNARAQKLIEKVCTALNELKEMGNIEFHMNCDYDAYIHDILDEVNHFDASMFKIRGK